MMNITDEMLALFLDGKASEEEVDAILDEWPNDSELRELLNIAKELNEEGIGNTISLFS